MTKKTNPVKNYKIYFLSIFLLTVLFSCNSQEKVYLFTSFHEPAKDGLRFLYSKDGLHWDSIPGIWLKPEIGNEKVMRDPSMVQTPDGTFHLVWTTSWKGDLGFGYSSSKDLIHWTKERMIPVMSDEPTTVNVWAPEIFYDDDNKDFVVVWASCIPHRFKKGIEDENNNHRLYYITTKDFKTISKARLLYDPGFSSIDATIVKRGERDYVMVFKDNTRPNRDLKVAFAKSPTGPYTPASTAFTESFTEGPTVEKVGNKYIIYYDAYREKIFGARETTDFIHFKDMTKKVSVPRGHKHGTIIKTNMAIVAGLEKAYELAQKQKKTSASRELSEAK